MGLAFAEGQTIFLFQFLADADIPLQPVAVGDSFAVVVHAVEDEVAMGIGGVVVTDYDILSVLGPKRRGWPILAQHRQRNAGFFGDDIYAMLLLRKASDATLCGNQNFFNYHFQHTLSI